VAHKILLVEDNVQNRYLMTFLLERSGYSVTVAEDGQEALDSLAAETPDIILMDMQLPRMDGYEATRRIKSDERLKGIPLVALTAHSMKGDRAKAVEAGCDEYVTKPVDADGLVALIERLITL
jgi:CheY-like chemotaxis protein